MLVGLLFNWKQERAATDLDHFQNFITWLSQHHHNELCEKINASTELQRELHELLSGDLGSLSTELARVKSALAAVTSKLTKLSKLSAALKVPDGELTDQSISVLKKFEELGATHLIIEDIDPESVANIYFDPEGEGFRVKEPRFLMSEIDALSKFNLIFKVDYSTNGQVAYTLTREGASFAQSSSLHSDCLLPSKPVQMHSGGGSFGY